MIGLLGIFKLSSHKEPVLIGNLAPMNANGPAIWGVCVGRRSIRAESSYPAPAGPENCHGARRPWRGFWSPGTN